MVALANRSSRTFTQAKPVRLPPRKPLPFPPRPRPLPPAAIRANKTPPPTVGEVERVAYLFERYAEQVRRFAYGRLWSYEFDQRADLACEAEDVVQETFERWMQLLREGYPLPPDSDEPYQRNTLLAIARHLCFARVNLPARWRWAMQARWPSAYYDPPAPPLLLRKILGSNDEAESSTTQERVTQALARIMPAHAALLRDAYMHDQSHAQLAAAHGIPQERVARMMRCARNAFRAAYH